MVQPRFQRNDLVVINDPNTTLHMEIGRYGRKGPGECSWVRLHRGGVACIENRRLIDARDIQDSEFRKIVDFNTRKQLLKDYYANAGEKVKQSIYLEFGDMGSETSSRALGVALNLLDEEEVGLNRLGIWGADLVE